VRADEPVRGSECTLQMLGNIRRRQILKRPTARRSFDINAQARGIIGELDCTARKLRSRSSACVSALPSDFPSAGVQQVLNARDISHGSQQCKRSDLRVRKRLAYAGGRGKKSSPLGNYIVDEHDARGVDRGSLHQERFEVARDSRAGTACGCRGFWYRADPVQTGPRHGPQSFLYEGTRKVRRRPRAADSGRASRDRHQHIGVAEKSGELRALLGLLVDAQGIFDHEMGIALFQQRTQQAGAFANGALSGGRINIAGCVDKSADHSE